MKNIKYSFPFACKVCATLLFAMTTACGGAPAKENTTPPTENNTPSTEKKSESTTNPQREETVMDINGFARLVTEKFCSKDPEGEACANCQRFLKGELPKIPTFANGRSITAGKGFQLLINNEINEQFIVMFSFLVGKQLNIFPFDPNPENADEEESTMQYVDSIRDSHAILENDFHDFLMSQIDSIPLTPVELIATQKDLSSFQGKEDMAKNLHEVLTMAVQHYLGEGNQIEYYLRQFENNIYLMSIAVNARQEATFGIAELPLPVEF